MARRKVSEKLNPSFCANALSASYWGMLRNKAMRFMGMIVCLSLSKVNTFYGHMQG